VSEPTLVPGAEPFRFPGGSNGLLLVHGFSGSPASLRPLGEWFAERDLSVVGVRLPGHGTSVEDLAGHGWPDWVAAVGEGLDTLRGSCDRIVLLGQSFGGALAVHTAAERSDEVDGLVLVSPYMFDPRMALVPLGRRVFRTVKGVGNDIRKPGQDEIAYDRLPVQAVTSMAAFLRIARRDLPRVRAPALVFRPGADHTIPRSNAAKVLERLGSAPKTMVECSDSYHVISLDHDAPVVCERTLAFVRSLRG
jgi:carboxylesterase